MMNTRVNFLGLEFENPILPASGPITEGLDNLKELSKTNLGGLVTKTISIKGAEVKKPCIVFSNGQIYNNELWSEYDLDYWLSILEQVKALSHKPLGISIGYGQDDFKISVPKLHPFADFFEVSTHYNKSQLLDLVKCVTALTDKPVLIKMSPHTENDLKFVETVLKGGGQGVVAFNSFGPGMAVDLKHKSLKIGNDMGQCWVSGPSIKPYVLQRIYQIKKHFPQLPLMGCGGIKTSKDVLEMILVGADMVQSLSSALIYGKGHYNKMIQDLPKLMNENDIFSIEGLRKTLLNDKVYGQGNYPEIKDTECIKCGQCLKVCPFQAWTFNENIKLNKSKCIRCGLCESTCPKSAIQGVLSQ